MPQHSNPSHIEKYSILLSHGWRQTWVSCGGSERDVYLWSDKNGKYFFPDVNHAFDKLRELEEADWAACLNAEEADGNSEGV